MGSVTSQQHGLPELDVLARQLHAVFGEAVDIAERIPNSYASRLPSEIVRVELAGGSARSVFCKHDSPRTLDVHGLSSGVAYEAIVYREVLAPDGRGTAALFGYAFDAASRHGTLFIESLENHVRVQKSADPSALTRAAAWIGAFHARHVEPTIEGVNVYDDDYYDGWSERSSQATPRVAALGRDALHRVTATLSAATPVVIHGEYYPDNVLVHDSHVRPVDWEWCGVAAGEIDLAALTEGWWADEQVAACIDAYCGARWPRGAPTTFGTTLDAARAYLHLRWLGGGRRHLDSNAVARRCSELERLLDRLDVGVSDR